MQFYLSIDDTDNQLSPGSGQLSDMLLTELVEHNLAGHDSTISRHQLYVHDLIPYTSHNSSMCFTAETDNHLLNDIIRFSQRFLEKKAATGSDPGLCIAVPGDSFDREALAAFGLRAKRNIISKEEALATADNLGVHLSEHGGTGDGIIGALAGVGLRMTGNDGRIRGWLTLAEHGQCVPVETLKQHPLIDHVVDSGGHCLANDAPVLISEPRLKTVLSNHLNVLPVIENETTTTTSWRTLTKPEIKKY